MKERPILMTPENAQKVFDGSKSQTRRIIKPQPNVVHGLTADGWLQTNQIFRNNAPGLRCPYGVPGDRLWVREAWQVDAPSDGTWADTQFYGCKGSPLSEIPERYRNPQHCLFKGGWNSSPIIWRPAIHMPRWACRTVVDIKEIRVERLQDISEEDAIAEGVQLDEAWWNPVQVYQHLWESINGKGSWAVNPWVWAISSKKITEVKK